LAQRNLIRNGLDANRHRSEEQAGQDAQGDPDGGNLVGCGHGISWIMLSADGVDACGRNGARRLCIGY
jgi:hypothetical protein